MSVLLEDKRSLAFVIYSGPIGSAEFVAEDEYLYADGLHGSPSIWAPVCHNRTVRLDESSWS